MNDCPNPLILQCQGPFTTCLDCDWGIDIWSNGPTITHSPLNMPTYFSWDTPLCPLAKIIHQLLKLSRMLLLLLERWLKSLDPVLHLSDKHDHFVMIDVRPFLLFRVLFLGTIGCTREEFDKGFAVEWLCAMVFLSVFRGIQVLSGLEKGGLMSTIESLTTWWPCLL